MIIIVIIIIIIIQDSSVFFSGFQSCLGLFMAIICVGLHWFRLLLFHFPGKLMDLSKRSLLMGPLAFVACLLIHQITNPNQQLEES